MNKYNLKFELWDLLYNFDINKIVKTEKQFKENLRILIDDNYRERYKKWYFNGQVK